MIDLEMIGGHCIYIKNMDVLFQKCLASKQIFTQACNLDRNSKDSSCNGGKTKLICNIKKSKHI